jgi:hypothetical protein
MPITTSGFAWGPEGDIEDKAEALIVEYAKEMGDLFSDTDLPAWHLDWILSRPNSKRKLRIPVPIHGLQVRPWKGKTQFDQKSRRWITVTSTIGFVGVQDDADTIEDYEDINGFESAPQDVVDAIDNYDLEQCADLFNNGHTLLDYTGKPFFALASDNARMAPGKRRAKKRVNRITSGALDDTTIKGAIDLLLAMERPDGRNLGFTGTHLLAPTPLFEQAKRICEVYQIVANVGAGVTGGITSGTFGRLKAVHVPQLSATRYIVAQQHKRLKPIVVTTRPGDLEPVMDLKDSAIYKSQRKLRVGMFVKRGYGLFVPHVAVAVDL